MKNKKESRLKVLVMILFVSILIVSFSGGVFWATYYLAPDGSDDWINLQECFSMMNGGDEFKMRDVK